MFQDLGPDHFPDWKVVAYKGEGGRVQVPPAVTLRCPRLPFSGFFLLVGFPERLAEFGIVPQESLGLSCSRLPVVGGARLGDDSLHVPLS